MLLFYSRDDDPEVAEAGVDEHESSETNRKSDAMTVQRAFATTKKVKSASFLFLWLISILDQSAIYSSRV